MRILRYLAILLTLIYNSSAFSFQLLIDGEVEKGIRRLIDPIFKAAGSDPREITVYIILDTSVNAFVANGRNIFINTGTITLFNDPDVLKGIVAHELGHIKGGHLARNSEKIKELTTQSIITSLIGAAAMMGGAREAGAAIMLGSGHTAQRGFLSHSRSQESAADQAAIKFLHNSHNSVRGLVKIQEYFTKEQYAIEDQINPYSITHPLSKERLSIAQQYLKDEKPGYGSSDDERKLYARVVAKIRGFTEPVDVVLRSNQKDLDPFARKYELAIALYRKPALKAALANLDGLIKEEPTNGYLHQTKGQFLFEHGQISESAEAYKHALGYLKSDDVLKAEYALALANQVDFEKDASKKKKILEEVIGILQVVSNGHFKHPYIYRVLATAYGKLGDLGSSNLMLAEEALFYYKFSEAQKFALIAKKYAQNDENLKLKIDDVLKTLRNIDN